MNLTERVRSALGRTPPPEPAPEPPPALPEPPPEKARFLLSDPTVARLLDWAESRLGDVGPDGAPEALAAVPLDVFALLAAHRPERWPLLRDLLPDMPDEETQIGMTGAAGEVVLLEAAGFVRAVAAAYGGRRTPLAQARILDYGVGWARVARLFLKYAPTGQVHGVDAWRRMLNMAGDCGFGGPLAMIESAPERLPFDEPFDLIYAFSIFTHLPEDMARAAVRAIHKGLKPDGLFALTVRPEEIWRLAPGEDSDAMIALHRAGGFAYRRAPSTPEFGDASFTLDYIERAWTDFRIEGVEVNAADPYQTVVLLAPR